MSHGLRSLASKLAKRDLIDVLEFSSQAGNTTTRAEYDALIRRLGQLLPVHGIEVRVAALGKDNEIAGTSAIASINYPQAWIDEYQSRALRLLDPVAPNIVSASAPLIWSELRKRFHSHGHREFYGSAAEHGLRDGFAYGQRFPGRASGSFVSCVSDDLAKHPRHSAVLALVSPHLHHALARCTVGAATDCIELTPREVEVLYGAKVGKTNPEIAADLSISARAVKFHLENAIAKLGAKGRTDAVVIALARGLIEW